MKRKHNIHKREVVKQMKGIAKRKGIQMTSRGSSYIYGLIIITILLTLFISGTSEAANSTSAGIVSAWASGTTSIKVKMTYSGDDNANNTYTIKWKLCTDGSYPPGNVINGSHTTSPYIAEITGLTANTCYNIEGTYNDADGVSGVNPQTLKIYSTWDSTLLHNSNRFQGTTKWGGNWGTSTGQYGQFECGTCHEPRASNIKGIKSTITAPSGNFPGSTVNFQSTTSPNGFGDDTGGHTTSTKVCEVCHTITSYHRYNTTGQSNLSHNNNTDCTQCHPHATGFYYATSACDSCHGNPPTTATLGGPTGLATPATGATNPLSAGAHNTHVSTRGMTCDACHRGTAMPASEKKIDMGFSISGTTYPGFQNTVESGTFTGYNTLSNGYTWNASWPGTTVNTAPNYNNSCSSIYCHGSTLTGGSNTQPSWVGGAAEAACGTCHGASASAPPTAGSHTKHASSATGNLGLACTKCHASVTDGSHVNGSVAWDLDDTDSRIGASATYRGSNAGQTGQLAPSSTYGNCSNLYCHSSVQPNGGGAGAPTYATPTWGGTVNCSSCHVDMSSSPSATGSHIKHAQTQGYACSICHNGAGSGTTLHANRNIEVTFSGIAADGSYSQSPNPPGNGYGTCSTVYCHSDGKGTYQTPTWGGTVACGDCHAVPPTTGAHVTHFGGTTAEAAYGNDGRISTTTAYKFNCGNCHPLSLSMHGNGTVDIELYNASATGFKANNPATATRTGTGTNTQCSDVYCHSNGADGANRAYKTTPTWGSTFGANKCGSCHDNPPQYAGQSHYVASNFMGKEGGHLVGIHFDNIYNGVAGSGLLTTGTGNNNSHGNSTYSTTITCYICHNGIVSSTTIDTYALNNLASSAMKCSNCHTAGSTTPLQNGVITDKSLHINATKNVAFVNAFTMKSKAQLRDSSKPAIWTRVGTYKTAGSYDTATINSSDWNSTTKTCTTACHNNQPVTWGDTGVTCYSCHTSL